MGKKLIAAVALAALCVVVLAEPAYAAPRVILDGRALTFDVSPVIENGRTLVPLRAIFEALGCTVDWDGDTSTVTAARRTVDVRLQLGNVVAYVNGRPVKLDVAAKAVSGRSLVPLRFVSEALGAAVDWDSATSRITITSPVQNGKGQFALIGGGIYVGDLLDGVPNGRGVITWPNGDRYDGQVRNRMPDGAGTFVFADGTRYEGAFVAGMAEGTGVMTWPSGDRYEGEFSQNERTGQGTLVWRAGATYTGAFVDGTPEGAGTIIWADGRCYTGLVAGGLPNGEGAMTWPGGRAYTGVFSFGEVADAGTTPGAPAVADFARLVSDLNAGHTSWRVGAGTMTFRYYCVSDIAARVGSTLCLETGSEGYLAWLRATDAEREAVTQGVMAVVREHVGGSRITIVAMYSDIWTHQPTGFKGDGDVVSAGQGTWTVTHCIFAGESDSEASTYTVRE